MAVATPIINPIRTRVVNDLHDPIRDLVAAIDTLERAYFDHEAGLAQKVRNVLAARDAYIGPMVRRAEEGR